MENWIKTNDLKCFKGEFSGFEDIKPINIIIGKNNSGKSTLLDLVKNASVAELSISNIQFAIKLMHLNDLVHAIRIENHQRSNINYADTVEKLKNITLLFSIKDHDNINVLYPSTPEEFSQMTGLSGGNTLAIYNQISKHIGLYIRDNHNNVKGNFIYNGNSINLKKFAHKDFYQLYADRNITSEKERGPEKRNIFRADGFNATNLVRFFLHSSKFCRDIIQKNVLNDLNTICHPDAHFSDISCQYSPSVDSDQESNKIWEIKLVEEEKGEIPLSDSGSGLKTIILVLLFLRVVVEKDQLESSIFAFEELENNLHPSMQKRLFHYIEDFALKHNCLFFITTHSNIVVDLFAGKQHAQIIHVTHDRKKSQTRTVSNLIDQKNVLDDIGSKASDLLMSNGIIWVEGPSDRIYFNKWLEIFASELKEGRHFEYVFFGGSNIASFTASADELLNDDKINLMKINKNAIVLVDSDISQEKMGLKPNVENVSKLSEELGFLFWATKGREVENYLPVEAINDVLKKDDSTAETIHNAPQKDDFPEVKQYQRFFHDSKDNSGYYQLHSGNKSYNKVDFARKVSKHFTNENLSPVLDLNDRMGEVVAEIKKWNEL